MHIFGANMTITQIHMRRWDAKWRHMLFREREKHGHHTQSVDITLEMLLSTTVATTFIFQIHRGHENSETVFFKHTYLTMPSLTTANALIRAADSLTQAIDRANPKTGMTRDAIDQLISIFKALP